jgi:hypothetical protein
MLSGTLDCVVTGGNSNGCEKVDGVGVGVGVEPAVILSVVAPAKFAPIAASPAASASVTNALQAMQ